MKHQLACS
jgi:CDP-diacylglycerol pyrophosphatase